jgi:hypothetical protein
MLSSSNQDGAALNAVTAFGGAGGGFYAGGLGLVGIHRELMTAAAR